MDKSVFPFGFQLDVPPNYINPLYMEASLQSFQLHPKYSDPSPLSSPGSYSSINSVQQSVQQLSSNNYIQQSAQEFPRNSLPLYRNKITEGEHQELGLPTNHYSPFYKKEYASLQLFHQYPKYSDAVIEASPLPSAGRDFIEQRPSIEYVNYSSNYSAQQFSYDTFVQQALMEGSNNVGAQQYSSNDCVRQFSRYGNGQQSSRISRQLYNKNFNLRHYHLKRGSSRLLNSSQKYCKFCMKNGETDEFCLSHELKDKDGGIICPVLFKYVCPQCFATGRNAHTLSYCNLNQ